MSNESAYAKIESIRKMTDEEMAREGWGQYHATPTVIELTNGHVLFPSSDPEGNGPGTMFGQDENNEPFYLQPKDD